MTFLDMLFCAIAFGYWQRCPAAGVFMYFLLSVVLTAAGAQ